MTQETPWIHRPSTCEYLTRTSFVYFAGTALCTPENLAEGWVAFGQWYMAWAKLQSESLVGSEDELQAKFGQVQEILKGKAGNREDIVECCNLLHATYERSDFFDRLDSPEQVPQYRTFVWEMLQVMKAPDVVDVVPQDVVDGSYLSRDFTSCTRP